MHCLSSPHWLTEALSLGLRAVFVYNPSDPFLQVKDVGETIQKVADDFGCKVEQVEVKHDHVQTIFRQPKAIFEAM